MYEEVTYESILERMLEKVPDNMDKREGSIIYDALAPAAVELQLMYIELDVILKETFADTASRDYLLRRAEERGITPKAATKAILKGVFTPLDIELSEGERFSCDSLNYRVLEKIKAGEYQMQCETEGVGGNGNFGMLIPVNYINGLKTAELTELLIPGEDEEETESIRQRYFQSFDSQAFGGNKKDYKDKVLSMAGIGAVKVIPVWNGGGTVKLTILDSAYQKAGTALLTKVQQQIDPADGDGSGIAPIGHVVTVDTPEELEVSVITSITYDTGYSFSALRSQIENAIKGYLEGLRKEWQDKDALVVRIAQIESRLLQIEGIIDVTDTKLNGTEENLIISSEKIPVFGGVSE